jgi:hypothetical protein
MAEKRGEKVVFGKGDFVPLDALPSASVEHSILLAIPKTRGRLRRFAKFAFGLLIVLGIAVGSLFIAFEQGYLDHTLTQAAEASMVSALGSDFKPAVGSIRLRFSHHWMLALEARDVRITHNLTNIAALTTSSIRATLDPLALMRGKLTVASIEIDAADADLRFLPAVPLDLDKIRVDALPAWFGLFYKSLDTTAVALEKSGTRRIEAASLTIHLPSLTGDDRQIRVDDFTYDQANSDRLDLSASLKFGAMTPEVHAVLAVTDQRVDAVSVEIANLATEPFLMKHVKSTGNFLTGLDTLASMKLESRRDHALTMTVTTAPGTFYADTIAQSVRESTGEFTYDFGKKIIVLSRGRVDLGATVLPLEGAIKDADLVYPGLAPGYGFELISNNAVAHAEASSDEPVDFSAETRGYFVPSTHTLRLDRIGVSTASGAFAGSLETRFVLPSPAVSFAARATTLQAATVKQLWPYWLAFKVRDWVIANISKGMIDNGEIDVSLAPGRIKEYPEPLILQKNEMRISFDLAGADLKFLPTVPPLTDAKAHFELSDRAVRADISAGNLTLASGKKITVRTGVFSIDDTAIKPDMANLKISAVGDASAVAELSNIKPFAGVEKLPFKTTELTGLASATVEATFGINKDQMPPPPVWTASLDLKKVGIKSPFQNHLLSNFVGTLDVDRKTAKLKGNVEIDGLPFDVSVNQPLGRAPGMDSSWRLAGDLSEADVLKYMPSAQGFYSGPTAISVEKNETGTISAKVSLTSASLVVPGIDWRKGPGIAANATFNFAEDQGQTQISKFNLDGDGFGAKGDLVVDKRGLISAKFSKVKLSPGDNFALSITRKGNRRVLTVTGNSIDVRPLIAHLRAGPSAASNTEAASNVSLKVDHAIGYNKESLSNVELTSQTENGHVVSLDLKAVTDGDQAVVMRRAGPNDALEITAGDAGALARFADIYRNMSGGLLNISLKPKDENSWRGSLDIRNFSIVNEERLQKIVSTRAGNDGKSLSEALKADINTSSQKFSRGFARLLLDGPAIRVENGVVRGDEVGATFQGTVRDENGRMDMTGTFMPAYGLNRLFADVPLIGVILGNGRDRGLLGITFKLAGPFEQPKLIVNPLSLIAPGVFRNIFEFQ